MTATRKLSAALVLIVAAALFLGPHAALAGEPPCPNEQLRAENNSTALPDCRAYELVSPPDTDGYPVASLGQPGGGAAGSELYQVTSGGAVFFVSQAMPPEAGAVPDGRAADVFVSERGSTGWATRDLTPFAASDPSCIGGSLLIAGSADASSALIDTAATLVPQDEDNPSDLANCAGLEGAPFDLYLVHQGQEPRLVSKGVLPRTAPPNQEGISSPFVFNATLSAVGFVSSVPLDPAASPAASDCYRWSDTGQLAALNGGGDNGASVGCSLLGMTPDGRPVIEDRSGDSHDGLLFIVGREFPGVNPGGSSEQISGSTPHAARFDAFAPDGGSVYVTTTDQLNPSLDTDADADIYAVAVPAFSPAFLGAPSPDSVTCVSCGHSGGGATFVGQSADGSHVFFSTSQGLWSWDEQSGVATELTTATDVSQVVSSANGQWIVGLTGQLANNPNGTRDVYEFAVGQPPRLITSGASADIYLLSGNFGGTSSFPSIGGVSNDGTRVVYDNKPANGSPAVIDEWVSGQTRQISPMGSTHPYFVLGTAGEELQDVFFLSDEALAPQDHNGGTTDIYDARIDGGLPYSPAISCGLAAGACQGPPAPPPPNGPVPGSSIFSGPGNGSPSAPTKPTHQKKECKKGKRIKSGKCVKAKTHRVRTASHNRGGAK